MNKHPVTVAVFNYQTHNINIITFIPDDYAITDLCNIEEPLSILLDTEYGINLNNCHWMQLSDKYSIKHQNFTGS